MLFYTSAHARELAGSTKSNLSEKFVKYISAQSNKKKSKYIHKYYYIKQI